MQANARAALNAFLVGRPARPATSIWTDGETLYSYATAIAQHVGDGRILFNATRYSKTTTAKQNAIRAELQGYAVTVVDDVPLGARCLERYARNA